MISQATKDSILELKDILPELSDEEKAENFEGYVLLLIDYIKFTDELAEDFKKLTIEHSLLKQLLTVKNKLNI